jgi:D-alanyl-D-alanine carboxypeptidase
VTKLHLAATVLRLVESGALGLSQSVSVLVRADTREQLAARGYRPEGMTVSQLLSHTSGLRDHAADDSYKAAVLASPAKRWTRSEQLAVAMALGKPLAEPGQVFSYSDTGYVILGEVVEQLAGRPLGATVRELLDFSALGISSTYWEDTELAPRRGPARASQFIGDADATHFDPSLDLFGGGGLVSTLEDLCTFVRALIQGRVFKEPGTLAAGLFVPRVERAPEQHLHSRLAMALPLGDLGGWGHFGFWGCGTVHCPDLDITVSVSINQAIPARDTLLGDVFSKFGRILAAQLQ